MTEQEVIHGNKLIAEFMEIPPCDRCEGCGMYKFGGGIFYTPQGMWYNASWEWLMPVIEKIEGDGYTFKICRRRVEVDKDGEHPPHPLILSKEETKIKSAYSAAVRFIQWRNRFGPSTFAVYFFNLP
jgi:hypothetical protein